MYKGECLNCGWKDGWIEETNLVNGHKCRCCTNQEIVKGINTLGDVRPDLIKYFENQDEAFQVFPRTDSKNVTVICQNCNNKIKITPDHLTTRGFVCRKCDDGFSYSEKFIFNFLQQLSVDFITQLNKKHFKWVNNYRYDFYLPDYNCIIETHGGQHYGGINDDDLQKIQINDENKKALAISNGIEYIVLDCRYSNVDWIKNSINQSLLSSWFNLSEIDWYSCHRHSVNSLVKIVSDYWNDNPNWSIKRICKETKFCKATVVKYLKQATELGWCNYNSKESYKRRELSKRKDNAKPINVYKNNIFLFSYPSAKKLADNSEHLLGVKLSSTSIREVCRGVCKTHKGFYFEDIKEELNNG